MSGPIALVVNPRAGKNRAGRELPTLMNALDVADANYEIHTTKHRGHAIELAAELAAGGASTVVAVGGDGTVNEVVNGLMEVDADSRPRFGVVAAGSGADFARSFDLPEHTNTHLQGIIGDTRSIDIGRLDFDRRRWSEQSGSPVASARPATSSRFGRFWRGTQSARSRLWSTETDSRRTPTTSFLPMAGSPAAACISHHTAIHPMAYSTLR